ncbi:Hypothetical protein SRAE_X000196200 [Strongyloides ratti]|uniref:Uncharacterized protein n=1 Tax=Strongyloides ratti TaxID=34506 RepID=A0A090KWK9_STRRB|nr:Hypothetical protein SRAE_X000196200 [Strongyloides ratti]CEF60222.1 Hypothetical protein SRAE_X000196200 [Strongyloides ratti]
MYFIKYFLVFALFAIQLSVQRSTYAPYITYEAYEGDFPSDYGDITTFNKLGSEGTRGSAGETTFEYVVGPAPTSGRSSKGIETKTTQNVLSDALKSEVAAAEKEFLENVLGGSYKYESDESSEEKPTNKKKGKSRFDSDENETSSKKKSSGGFVKSFKNKVAGSVKDGIKKKLASKFVQKSIPAEDTTFDELSSEETQESAEVIAFNELGDKIPQEPAKVIAVNEIGNEILQDSVEEPTKKLKKDSKVKKVLKTASHFLKGALKTGVSAAGHGLLGNILGGSSKNKKSKNGNGLFKGLFGSKKDNSESDESSEEKSKNKKKGENKFDSDENEASSKKKLSGSFVVSK